MLTAVIPPSLLFSINMLLLKRNEFAVNHLIPGLLLNFLLLKLIISSSKSGLAHIRLLIYSASALLQINTMLLLLKLSIHSMLLLFLLTLLIHANFGLLSIKFIHRKISNSLPTCPDSTSVSKSFAYFFSSKIHKIHTNLLSDTSQTFHIPFRDTPSEFDFLPFPDTPAEFDFFMPALVDEISKLIDESNDTYCDLNPIPSSLLKKCKFALLPTITNISSIFLLLWCFFLINLNLAQFILSLRNVTVIKMTCLYLCLICLFFLY
jgi:hypothetical protein